MIVTYLFLVLVLNGNRRQRFKKKKIRRIDSLLVNVNC